jgi:hypothetical protein
MNIQLQWFKTLEGQLYAYCDLTAECRNGEAIATRQGEGKLVSMVTECQQYEPVAMTWRRNITQQYRPAMGQPRSYVHKANRITSVEEG